jgi:hypothetical protein
METAMRAGAVLIVSAAFIAAVPRGSAAQVPFQPGPGPAALEVPHPIPPPLSTLPVPPRDLFQQPTPPPVTVPTIPTVVYPFVYGPSMYAGSTYMAGTPNAAAPVILKIAQGGLRFESSPGSAQVYIDGRYVGVIDDFGMSGHALDLDEGLHRVELRATGYATLSFDINIAANQTTRYRGDLPRLSLPLPPSAPAVAAPPMPPKTTYVIPNCYAGDRPPTRALRRGCEISKMLVRKP